MQLGTDMATSAVGLQMGRG